MKTKRKIESYQIIASVLLSMAIIIAVWAIWFFPLAQNQSKNDGGFSNFAKETLNSFSIFINAQDSRKQQKVDIDDLRERVFGDQVSRKRQEAEKP